MRDEVEEFQKQINKFLTNKVSLEELRNLKDKADSFKITTPDIQKLSEYISKTEDWIL